MELKSMYMRELSKYEQWDSIANVSNRVDKTFNGSETELSTHPRRYSNQQSPGACRLNARSVPAQLVTLYSTCRFCHPQHHLTGSGRLLIFFFQNSKLEKKMVLIMQDLAMETPRPRYMDALLN